jgi:hypothetical protein
VEDLIPPQVGPLESAIAGDGRRPDAMVFSCGGESETKERDRSSVSSNGALSPRNEWHFRRDSWKRGAKI